VCSSDLPKTPKPQNPISAIQLYLALIMEPSSTDSQPIVLITGITGYLGSYVCLEFLNKAKNYRVRGTVRDSKNESKLAPLKSAFGVLYNSLEIVEADLNNKQSLISAAKDCYYIIHTASPVPSTSSKMKEEDFIKPAVEGMHAILEAATQNKVKRLVLTSSMSTIFGAGWKGKDGTYSEADFAPEEHCGGYEKSKIRQENVCRDFLRLQETIASDYKLEVVTLHPGFILGPSLIKSPSSSISAIAAILNNSYPGMPRLHVPCVDIRDVALAHYEACFKEGLQGERILLARDSHWMIEFCRILQHEFRP